VLIVVAALTSGGRISLCEREERLAAVGRRFGLAHGFGEVLEPERLSFGNPKRPASDELDALLASAATTCSCGVVENQR
jgi:hypothetical protein